MKEDRAMPSKVRVLLVGAAFGADLHLDGYARCQDIAEVVAVCGRDPEKVRRLVDKFGLREAGIHTDFERAISEVDCDLVDVCLPNYMHHDVAMAAIRQGRDVIVEKPLATTVADAEEMVEAARAAGRRIYYAEDWFFAPALRKARRLLDEGAIGKLLYIRARESHSGSHSPYAQTLRYCGGGAMIHLGIHPLGFVLALKDYRWTDLVAMSTGGLEKNVKHKKLEGEDWASCLLRFEDGTTATVDANYITSGGMEDTIDFYGDQGVLHVDLTQSSAVQCFSVPGPNYTIEKAEVTTGWSRPVVDERYDFGYVDEIRCFMECCAAGVEAPKGLTGEAGLEALRVVDLIYRSAREGLAVKNDRL
jgi:predicted dehydrogenase